MILENNGIITDENYYQDREYITASMVKASLQGSKKTFDYIMQEREPTEAMLVGSAFHSMMLEPEKFKSEYAFEPAMDRRTKAGKEYIKQWQEENAHIPNHIPGKHEQTLINMHDSLLAHPTYNNLVEKLGYECGEREVIKLFELEGVKCKAKVDFYNPKENYIVDIKTCSKIDMDSIIQSINDYQYGVQAAFYLDGLKAHRFFFAFIEKKEPYDVLIVEFKSGLDECRKLYGYGIKNIQQFNTIEDVDAKNCYAAFNKIITL